MSCKSAKSLFINKKRQFVKRVIYYKYVNNTTAPEVVADMARFWIVRGAAEWRRACILE